MIMIVTENNENILVFVFGDLQFLRMQLLIVLFHAENLLTKPINQKFKSHTLNSEKYKTFKSHTFELRKKQNLQIIQTNINFQNKNNEGYQNRSGFIIMTSHISQPFR